MSTPALKPPLKYVSLTEATDIAKHEGANLRFAQELGYEEIPNGIPWVWMDDPSALGSKVHTPAIVTIEALVTDPVAVTPLGKVSKWTVFAGPRHPNILATLADKVGLTLALKLLHDELTREDVERLGGYTVHYCPFLIVNGRISDTPFLSVTMWRRDPAEREATNQRLMDGSWQAIANPLLSVVTFPLRLFGMNLRTTYYPEGYETEDRWDTNPTYEVIKARIAEAAGAYAHEMWENWIHGDDDLRKQVEQKLPRGTSLMRVTAKHLSETVVSRKTRHLSPALVAALLKREAAFQPR